MLELKAVRMDFPADANIIVGQSHFIKTVEDLYEAIVTTVPQAKFGVAFNESSGACLTRSEGNEQALRDAAIRNAQALGSGHTFVVILQNAYPINVLQGEAAALDALHAFADSLGLDVSDLEVLEPLPGAHAYCGFVAWLALYGSDAELAGGFLINFAAWGANCGRMRTGHSMRSMMLPQQRSPSSTSSQICLLSNRKLWASFKMPLIGVCPHDSFTRRRACYKAMS